jgi:DNA modification methylase
MEASSHSGAMVRDFGAPPFTILDARQGYWTQRKKQWLALGVQGAAGRADGLVYNSSVQVPQVYTLKDALRQDLGREPSQEEVFALAAERGLKPIGTSVFDPVLAELCQSWFCPPGGAVLDPFAGEATKGIVAAALGLAYTGIEVRPEQVEANRGQWAGIAPKLAGRGLRAPEWILGDAANLSELLPVGAAYDLIFTSPPYFDLEKYSSDTRDGSAIASYATFMAWYQYIFAQAVDRLRPGRFLVVKVGEIRDPKGVHRNFVGRNIACFTDLGLHYYNEAVLLTKTGSLPIRAKKPFTNMRKLGRSHQNVLVFYKGDIKDIPNSFPREVGRVDLPE